MLHVGGRGGTTDLREHERELSSFRSIIVVQIRELTKLVYHPPIIPSFSSTATIKSGFGGDLSEAKDSSKLGFSRIYFSRGFDGMK